MCTHREPAHNGIKCEINTQWVHVILHLPSRVLYCCSTEDCSWRIPEATRDKKKSIAHASESIARWVGWMCTMCVCRLNAHIVAIRRSCRRMDHWVESVTNWCYVIVVGICALLRRRHLYPIKRNISRINKIKMHVRNAQTYCCCWCTAPFRFDSIWLGCVRLSNQAT